MLGAPRVLSVAKWWWSICSRCLGHRHTCADSKYRVRLHEGLYIQCMSFRVLLGIPRASSRQCKAEWAFGSNGFFGPLSRRGAKYLSTSFFDCHAVPLNACLPVSCLAPSPKLLPVQTFCQLYVSISCFSALSGIRRPHARGGARVQQRLRVVKTRAFRDAGPLHGCCVRRRLRLEPEARCGRPYPWIPIPLFEIAREGAYARVGGCVLVLEKFSHPFRALRLCRLLDRIRKI